MFRVNDNIRIGDFGLSITFDGTLKASSSFGTLDYRSPELLDGKPYKAKSDIWFVI
jgi:serine/threonine protein kinase